VAYFDPKILTIAPDATAEDALGRDRPITQADVDAGRIAFEAATQGGLATITVMVADASGAAATDASWT
jgi:hypothetical protein